MNETYNTALALYKELWGILGSKRDWIHYDQMFRSASSIVVNIAEATGKERAKQGASAYSLAIARGELFETLAWLDIALIEGIVSLEEVQKLRGKLKKLGGTLKESIEIIDKSQYLTEEDPVERQRKLTLGLLDQH